MMEARPSPQGRRFLRDHIDDVLAQTAYVLVRRTLGIKRYNVVIKLIRAVAHLSSNNISYAVLSRINETYQNEIDITHSAGAQRDLLKISRIFPDEKILFARLLRIGARSEINPEIGDYIGKTATASVLSDPEIRLLLLFQRIKNEQFSGAVRDFLTIPSEAIERDPLLIEVWRISTIHLIVKNEQDYFINYDPILFVRYVDIERHPDILLEILMKLLYKQIQPDLIAATIDLLATRDFDGSPESFAVVFFFLMICGYIAHGERLADINARYTKDSLHPLYIRGKLFPLGFRDKARSVPPSDMERTSRDQISWQLRTADVLKAEIGARLQNLSSRSETVGTTPIDGRLHILIALFGQMRFPSRTLPGIKRWIDENFPASATELKISYSVSTWRATGSKAITRDDSFDYLLPYYPAGCEPILRRMNLQKVSDAEDCFPHFLNAVLTRFSSAADIVSELEIENLLQSKIHFEIDDDENFMLKTGNLIAEFAPSDRHILNQGRMIDRIGAIGNIIERLERDSNAITHVLFIRPDLHKLSGSIANCLDHMRLRQNWALVDQDHLAELIEGVGDRFILADRMAASHIVRMSEKVRRIFREVPRNHLACSRLHPHKMLASVLFEHSVETRTVPRSDIEWEFLRANFTSNDFVVELSEDIIRMPPGDSKRELMKIVQI